MKNMNVLITGATGFLGSHLVHAFLKAGNQVSILKRSTSDMGRLRDIIRQIKSYDTDVSPMSDAFPADNPYDIVINTAAIYGRHGENAMKILDSNIKFSLSVLCQAIDNHCSRFINTDTSNDRMLNEYSLSKQQFAEWGRLYSKKGKIEFCDIRLEHMYGPGDDSTKFVDYVMQQCLQNVPELKLTEGKQKRDFIYIDDVVDAYMKLAEADLDDYSEFSLGSGVNHSIRDLVELIHSLTKSSTKLMFGALPYRENETMESKVDISGLRRLGWKPEVTLEEGITKILEAKQDENE